MLKLPLFLLILVTVEELLPLMVIYTPFLLPSTCILPSQRLKIRKRFELKRETRINELRAMVAANSSLQPPYEVQEADATLNALPKEALQKLMDVYNLSAWGGSALQRSRLVRHLRLLRTDDMRLATSTLLNEPSEESSEVLADACTERGMYVFCSPSRAANVTVSQKIDSLRTWLELTQVETAVPDLELALMPTRIVERGQSELELEAEVKSDEKRSVAEQTNTVVQEVVEQEKRNEGTKKP